MHHKIKLDNKKPKLLASIVSHHLDSYNQLGRWMDDFHSWLAAKVSEFVTFVQCSMSFARCLVSTHNDLLSSLPLQVQEI